MSKHEFPELTGADSVLYEFLEQNKDLQLEFRIRFVRDLGIQVRVTSDDTVLTDAGHSMSASTALERAVERTKDPVKEYREYHEAND